ncbi:hypothetical protein LZZ85_10035 [Terrimonas sp. NA20]|uniref:Collagen-like protein n=1 Tax=Terrimonas ginsenosidimutans TaxID=2908004 RepID=A0ABS9KQP3_9BACT|nr:hypothetical protein [Terrimonas ginsenosidimutans]MCG2614623.1 hypothetical protein [Terrimonas ginsenosidimutans]
MRKLRFLALSSLAVLFIASSCTKEGPEGPAGAAGAQGPAGTPGTPGTPGAGQTIYSDWYTTVAADWVEGYIAPNNYNVSLVYNRAATAVTQAILDRGVVLCYGKNFTIGQNTRMTSAVLLPYLENFNGQHYGAIASVGKITFTYDPVDGADRPIAQIAGIAYRYIVIAGSLSGRSMKYGGFTKDQLQNMTYEQVASTFDIPAVGGNVK